MIDETTLEALRKRYPQVHPLLFQRSVERAKSGGDLFDILETVPEVYPILWSDKEHRWVHTDDILQAEQFKLK